MKKALAISIFALSAMVSPALAQDQTQNMDQQSATASQEAATYSQDEITAKAEKFFGKSSKGVGKVVEKIFADQGQPSGYIYGSEVAGAVGFGLRYGDGTLVMKDGTTKKVYWQGPSVGFDTGGNGSKVFTLVYNLNNPAAIYRRYPGVEGAAFFIAGISATYQQAEGVVLAPMRTGVGMRAGANIGYTAYSSKRRWNPF